MIASSAPMRIHRRIRRVRAGRLTLGALCQAGAGDGVGHPQQLLPDGRLAERDQRSHGGGEILG